MEQVQKTMDRRPTQFEMMFEAFDKNNAMYSELLNQLENFVNRFVNPNDAKEAELKADRLPVQGHLSKLDDKLTKLSQLNIKLEHLVDRLQQIA